MSKSTQDILAELDNIHDRLSNLWYSVDNMNWGRQTTRKDGDNIKYILDKVISIDNQVYGLHQSIMKGE
jgi:hypothetical protein